MTQQEEREEVIVNFEYSGDSLTLSETDDGDYEPGAHPGEARVEVDPLVEAFARSPYDPVIGSMMMGRATGEVIANPPDAGWMRAVAGLLAVGLIAQFPLVMIINTGGNFLDIQLSSPGFVVSMLLGLGGLLLAARLLRASAD